MDQLINSTAGHELLSFLVAYSGYNQIKMDPKDQDKTSFITDKDLLLQHFAIHDKNIRAMYQRLVTRMFQDYIDKSKEVYIDDIIVKLIRADYYLAHLKEIFEVLRKYMKLNPEKCAFGVGSGKFFGFLVSNGGIEVNPMQIKAIETYPKC